MTDQIYVLPRIAGRSEQAVSSRLAAFPNPLSPELVVGQTRPGGDRKSNSKNALVILQVLQDG